MTPVNPLPGRWASRNSGSKETSDQDLGETPDEPTGSFTAADAGSCLSAPAETIRPFLLSAVNPVPRVPYCYPPTGDERGSLDLLACLPCFVRA